MMALEAARLDANGRVYTNSVCSITFIACIYLL